MGAVRDIYDRVCHSSCEHDDSSSINNITECAGRSSLLVSLHSFLVHFIFTNIGKDYLNQIKQFLFSRNESLCRRLNIKKKDCILNSMNSDRREQQISLT